MRKSFSNQSNLFFALLLVSYSFPLLLITEIENDVEKENQKNRQKLWKTSVQAMRLCHVCILFSFPEKLNGNEEDYYDYYRNDGI